MRRHLIVFLELVHFQNDVANLSLRLGRRMRHRRGPVDVIVADTAGRVSRVFGHIQHRNGTLIAAPRDKVIAARAKVAALGAFMGQGEIAGDSDQRARGFVGTGQRNRPEQSLCIGMAHAVEHIRNRPALDRLAGVHDTDAIAGVQHQPEVVADEQHRGAVFAPQIFDQINDRRFDRDIQCCGGLVQDQQGWL